MITDKSDVSVFFTYIVPFLSNLLFSDIGATLIKNSRKQQYKFDKAFRSAGLSVIKFSA